MHRCLAEPNNSGGFENATILWFSPILVDYPSTSGSPGYVCELEWQCPAGFACIGQSKVGTAWAWDFNGPNRSGRCSRYTAFCIRALTPPAPFCSAVAARVAPPPADAMRCRQVQRGRSQCHVCALSGWVVRVHGRADDCELQWSLPSGDLVSSGILRRDYLPSWHLQQLQRARVQCLPKCRPVLCGG